MRNLIDEEQVDRVRYTELRLHRINADSELLPLSVSSKFNAERDFLEYLHDIGFATADRWLESNFEKLGHESTIQLSAM